MISGWALLVTPSDSRPRRSSPMTPPCLQRALSAGFIEPCLPSPAEKPPSGPGWVHEIKHDGYRLMARRDPVGIRLLTRNGYDWSPRYPLIVEAVNHLKVRSCLIDGEAVACDKSGLAVFDLLRRKPTGNHVFMYAFDLLELDGADLRREPIETRKATLASLRDRLRPRLQARHRVQAPRLALSFGPYARLAQIQEPGGAGGEAGGGGGVGQGAVAATRLRIAAGVRMTPPN